MQLSFAQLPTSCSKIFGNELICLLDDRNDPLSPLSRTLRCVFSIHWVLPSTSILKKPIRLLCISYHFPSYKTSLCFFSIRPPLPSFLFHLRPCFRHYS
eukprot:UN09794